MAIPPTAAVVVPPTPTTNTPAPAETVDADIAAFMAENPDAANGEPDAPEPDGEPAAEGGEPDGEGDDGADSADPEAQSTDEPEGDEAPSIATAVDLKALKAALEKDDPVAFVKALGKKAESLLSSKAHRALRLQVKEVEKAQAKAVAAQSRADELATKLGEKYGDPIAARKAAETGDVDSFVTLIEKWSGHPWNDVMRWVTNGIAGRKERLEAKARETNEATQRDQAKREQAQAEVRDWCDKGVKKLAADLHSPEVVQMVVDEIRIGFANGITTPAKALPLVRKKLEAQYKMLHKVFGKGQAPPKPRRPAPSARALPAEGQTTRELSLDEEIAQFKREQGLR
jgi:hypothetical protein